jgi:hypothetical protein
MFTFTEGTPPTAVPVYFPQVADGGGFTTQFILFSGTAGQTTSGNIEFVKQDGEPGFSSTDVLLFYNPPAKSWR